MASTSDIKNGLCITHNHAPYQIIEFLHVKPGKGAAFVRTKMRNLNDGRVLEHTFPSGAKLDDIRIEYRTYQFLYNDADGYHFMNMESYEQLPMAKELINAPGFLKDGMECMVLFHADEDRPLSVEVPQTVVMEVTYTEPGMCSSAYCAAFYTTHRRPALARTVAAKVVVAAAVAPISAWWGGG